MADPLPALGAAYAFVRRDFGLSAHNYEFTRRFVGALAVGRAEGHPVTLLPEDENGFMAPFAVAKAGDSVEREGELIRRTLAPDKCSRLGGVFVFADRDSCERASHLYGWDLSTVRQGRAYGAWAAYDMQIVSALRMAGLSASTRMELWQHYWRGEPGASYPSWDDLLIDAAPHREPLWEWLVDGYVEFEANDRSPFA